MTNAPSDPNAAPPLAKLPPDVSILREHPTPPGWVAYYFDPAEKTLFAHPVIFWAMTEAEWKDEDDESFVAQEYRPFVLTRPGAIVEAQEPETPFLTILGPGVDHLDCIRHLIRKRYPDIDATTNFVVN